MYIFKTTRNPDNEYDISEITFNVDVEDKSELIEEFGRFLLACGFQLNKGDLDEL
tara:strand:- start:182 stop:346 length:165 start_codon:yes stop_codon:yes gene_type:complete